MISERKFAERFTSFWHDALPRGAFVSRYINLQKDRFAPPFQSDIPAERRALVNEIGFQIFINNVVHGQIKVAPLSSEHLVGIGRKVVEDLTSGLPLTAVELREPNFAELEEAGELAERLANFFLEYEADEVIAPMPEFAGCGILESCRGDVLAGVTLYEVKSGEGNFRLTDLRQVLAYCALNHALPRYSIRTVGLLNPRMGVYFTADLDTLVRSASGVPADSLFFEMAHFLTSQGVSG